MTGRWAVKEEGCWLLAVGCWQEFFAGCFDSPALFAKS